MGDANTSTPTSEPAPMSAFAYTDLPMRVHYTDGSVHKEACITILASIDLEKNKLADLRDHIGLASDKKDSPLLGFCTKEGANVADAFSIKEYLNIGLGVDTSEGITGLVVYLKKEGLATAGSSQQTEVSSLGQYIDADKLARLKQHFDGNAFKLLTGTAAKYVAELEEQDWSIVAENNALCYGMRFVREKSEGGNVIVGIERARYPAFRLKKRTIFSDTLTSTSVKDVEMELRIPDYRVDDQSYVSTFETDSRIQAALAQSSFSEVDVEAAASASMFGCTASGSVGLNTTSSSNSTSATAKASKKVTIAYNFPRITIMLDRGDNLELTPACQTRLTSAMTSENATLMKDFLEDYGEIFSTQVQLGGRLFATEDVESGSKEDAAQVARSMKASAAASFRGWGASVSVSASYEDKSSHSQSEKGSTSTRALACPPAWSASVAYHWNWRITKQDKVVPLISRLSKFRGFDTLLDKAKEWNIASEGDDGPGKDLQSILKEESEKYQKFYLPRDRYHNSWLAVYSASECSLTRMVDCWNKYAGVNIEMLPSLANRGLCCLYKGGEKEDFEFQAETPDGKPVGEISYRERYRLVNSKKKLYVDWYDTQGKYFLFANPVKGPVMEFRDVDAPEKTGLIPSGAAITLNFYYRDDDTDDKGGLWYQLTDPSASVSTDYVTLRKEHGTALMFKPVE